MAKELVTKLKLQIQGGAATPAPPVGPALGQHGLNIQDFVNKFNEATKDKRGDVVPVEVSVYKDRTPLTEKAGKVTWAQCKEIAEIKMEDLNAADVDAGGRTIAGTARQMGLEVTGIPN